MCVGVFPACMSVNHKIAVPMEVRFPGTGVSVISYMGSRNLPWVVWNRYQCSQSLGHFFAPSLLILDLDGTSYLFPVCVFLTAIRNHFVPILLVMLLFLELLGLIYFNFFIYFFPVMFSILFCEYPNQE